MFLELPPSVAHSDPWTEDFEHRFAELKRGKVRVAYYYDYVDSSTFRYRVHNMIELLREGHESKIPKEVSASWFCFADAENLPRVAEAADFLVICRARYTHSVNALISRAKNLGCSVIFDVDDLVIDTRHAHLLALSLDQDLSQETVWDQWFSYVARVGMTMRMCDRVITTNRFLADQIYESSQMKVSVVPNFINQAQMDISGPIFAAKLNSDFRRNDLLHIGYFSGSPSHNKDFEIVSDALARLMDRDPRLRLRVVGYLDVKGPVMRHSDRIERYPMQDYVNLQALIGSTEINIAPLQENIFTNCKSELKYFEASIVGTVTVASPTFTFRSAIKDGERGWLARSYEWEEKLALAIAALDRGSDDYRQIVSRAHDHAQQAYSAQSQTEALHAALFGSQLRIAGGLAQDRQTAGITSLEVTA